MYPLKTRLNFTNASKTLILLDHAYFLSQSSVPGRLCIPYEGTFRTKIRGFLSSLRNKIFRVKNLRLQLQKRQSQKNWCKINATFLWQVGTINTFPFWFFLDKFMQVHFFPDTSSLYLRCRVLIFCVEAWRNDLVPEKWTVDPLLNPMGYVGFNILACVEHRPTENLNDLNLVWRTKFF